MTNQRLELEIDNIAHGGEGVGRLDGKVYFVAGTIPGEKVLVEVLEDKKRFARAELIDVLDPSPHRQLHIWSESSYKRPPEDRAGGADYGHIEISKQLEFKTQILSESLARFASFQETVTVNPIAGEADGTMWRTRVSLHVDEAGNVGPYAQRSHRVIPVASLPLATEKIQSAEIYKQNFAGCQKVSVIDSSVSGLRLIVDKQKPETIKELVGTREFELSDAGFWQVHRFAAETLSNAVRKLIDKNLFDAQASNLDLYGGVGLLAAAVLEDYAGAKLISVESDELASEYAGKNLSFGDHARSEAARVDQWLAKRVTNGEKLNNATVVLDPPRSGAGKAVIDSLATLGAKQLIYVACDPVALARDIAIAQTHGFNVAAIEAFDLFPNTHHIEAVVRLVR